MKNYYLLLLIVAAGLTNRMTGTPSVRLVLNVASTDGSPVPGARVGVGSYYTATGVHPQQVTGVTDAKGYFSATIGSETGEVVAYAQALGFYETQIPVLRLGGAEDIRAAQQSGRWSPWERPVNVVLRPIKRPVPMYAKRVDASLPANDMWIGYDFEKGDWVAPYGKGATIDCEFFGKGGITDRRNYQGVLELRFTGAGNGIVKLDLEPPIVAGSELRMPYEAPADGYSPTWTWRNSHTKEDKSDASRVAVDDSKVTRNFFFRIRSVLDENKRVIRACYGKIHGPFIFDPRGEKGNAFVSFTYYLNPDETRNVEFDQKRNLFVDIKSTQRPESP